MITLEVPPGILWAAAGFVVVQALNWVNSLRKRNDQVKEDTVKDLTAEMKRNTEAMIELRVTVGTFRESIHQIPTLQQEVKAVQTRVRRVEEHMHLAPEMV